MLYLFIMITLGDNKFQVSKFEIFQNMKD